jgi:hypothetical protein
MLDFIREAEREAIAKLGDEGAGIIESALLFVSPLLVLVGRHWSTNGCAAEAHAARPNLDHDECVWQRVDGSKT